jgi:hypothetical protein
LKDIIEEQQRLLALDIDSELLHVDTGIVVLLGQQPVEEHRHLKPLEDLVFQVAGE